MILDVGQVADVDQDHEPERRDLADPDAEHEQRHEQDDGRHDHQGDQHPEHDVAPAERPVGEAPGGESGDEEGQRHRREREEHRVGEPARELVAELLGRRQDIQLIGHLENRGYGQSVIDAFRYADARGKNHPARIGSVVLHLG